VVPGSVRRRWCPFAWVFEDTAFGDIQAAVLGAAHRLARLALDRGDPTLASWAAQRGRAADRLEEVLYEDRFEAAAMAGDRAEFERVRLDAEANLGPASEGSPVWETYRRLLGRWRGVDSSTA
jgi:hypothetical protein